MVLLISKCIIIVAIVDLATPVLSFSCNLNYHKNKWLDDWHVLLMRHSDDYELLRGSQVAANENFLVLCNNKRQPVTVGCFQGTGFNETLPLNKHCVENESLRPVRITEKVSYCVYTLYKIGFNVKVGSNTHFLEAYQVCFDQIHMRTLFTISKVYPVGGGRPQFLQFNPDDIFYGRYFHAFDRASTLERFRKLLGQNQPYMSESNIDHIIDRGHLTPSADFSLTNLKRSTFNMINVIPQFKSIDNGNWRLIEEWVRHPSRTPANVCTGVLDCNLDGRKFTDFSCILKLRSSTGLFVPIFLADHLKVPIPLWSYKIVKNNKLSLVFLTLNNIYHKGVVQVPENICRQIKCPLELSQTVREGWTFCCEYDEFIKKNVPHLEKVC